MVPRLKKDRNYLPCTSNLISAIAVAAIVIVIMVMITAVVMPMMMMVVVTMVMIIPVMMIVPVTVVAVVTALAIIAHVVDPMAEEIVLSEHQLAAALAGDIASSVRSHGALRWPQHGNSNRSQHDSKHQSANKPFNFHKALLLHALIISPVRLQPHPPSSSRLRKNSTATCFEARQLNNRRISMSLRVWNPANNRFSAPCQ